MTESARWDDTRLDGPVQLRVEPAAAAGRIRSRSAARPG